VSRSERAKGLKGEHEVRELYERHGFEVRGLEGTGDHLALLHGIETLPGGVTWANSARRPLTIHSESKRQETARPWQWWAQAEAEAPAGTLAVVAFRRNRSPWLALADLDRLAAALAR
jgi:hypothetical protein